MNRRGFLRGLASALAAPAVVTTPGLLMPLRGILMPVASGAVPHYDFVNDPDIGMYRVGDGFGGFVVVNERVEAFARQLLPLIRESIDPFSSPHPADWVAEQSAAA